MNDPGIVVLQHWMKEVITCQGAMPHKLQRATDMYGLRETEVIAATRDISIYTRMNVYTSGYMMRLLECISADFPVLEKFMGEEVFSQFAKASLTWSPSTSYTLYDLGNTFINFLEATRPTGSGMSDDQQAFLDLPVAIARAERARQEAIRSHGLEDINNTTAEVFPGQILFQMHLLKVATPPCLRLLEQKFPVKQLIENLYHDQEYEFPEPRRSFLAVSRMHYRLTMEELEEWQYLFLQSCQATTMLMDAINNTATATSIAPAALMADLCLLLPVFQQKGFIVLENSEPGGII